MTRPQPWDFQVAIGEYDLFVTKVDALRLMRKFEFFQTAFNRQFKCRDEVVDALLDKAFSDWNKKAEEIFGMLEPALIADNQVNLLAVKKQNETIEMQIREFENQKKVYTEQLEYLAFQMNPSTLH